MGPWQRPRPVPGGGLTSRNNKELPYKNVRRPVYPLDLD